jgi:hypothetical protein
VTSELVEETVLYRIHHRDRALAPEVAAVAPRRALWRCRDRELGRVGSSQVGWGMDPGSARDQPTESPAPSGGYTLGLGSLVFELLLPVTLCAVLLLVLARYTPRWDLHTHLGQALFGLLLVALSLVVSLWLDARSLARRQRKGRKQLLNRAGRRARLVKFALGGIGIPIAALAAANLLELPNHQTPMSMVLSVRFPGPPASREEELGDAVLRASSPAARVQGIRALQGVGSGEALEQLLRVLRDDPAALRGGSEAEALRTALASYGARAKASLLLRLNEAGPSVRREASAPSGDLFERYLSADFEELRHEIDRRLPDPGGPAGGQGRLELAQAELKRALSQVEADTLPAEADRSLPGFVMQTFLQMDLRGDAELLAFARTTAADAGWSEAVRGQALLLVAKVGQKDDLDGLYGYLDNPSALLQARAMQAIAELQSRPTSR